MTKKEEKILVDIDKLIDGLHDNFSISSGVLGAMQEATNNGMIIGLKMARKSILLNVTK